MASQAIADLRAQVAIPRDHEETIGVVDSVSLTVVMVQTATTLIGLLRAAAISSSQWGAVTSGQTMAI